MSQVPPPSSMPYPPQGFQPPPQARTNGAAIASLICGIIGCIPVVNLVAIVLGFIGIGKSKQPSVGGKGMAITGIVLGFVWLIAQIGGVGLAYYGYGKAKELVLQPTQQVGSSFLNNLADGNVTTAESFTTGEFSSEQLQKLAAQVKSYGKFKSFSLNQVQATPVGDLTRFNIGGTANFEGTSKGFHGAVVGKITDPKSFKIENLTVD